MSMSSTLHLPRLAAALAVATLAGAVVTPHAEAQPRPQYRVTITNLTPGQAFTPFLVATHSGAARVFAAGEAASTELREVAENGNTVPLSGVLADSPNVADIGMTEGLLAPGASVSLDIDGGRRFGYLSLVSMLIPTNDAFVGLDSVMLPGRGSAVTLYAWAFDAGTEQNDELCSSIPGPHSECDPDRTPGAPGNGEGAIVLHGGIHGATAFGSGDFLPARRDWRGPVAMVRIERLR
jgi:hypothetical protein